MPVLKSEKGKVDPDDPKDAQDVDLVAKTPFFKQHEKAIVQIRDGMTMLLYFALFGVLSFTTWINMERGAFPFNVDVLAKIAYWRNQPGTPFIAFGIGLALAVIVVMARRKALGVVESSIGEQLTAELQKRGHLRKIKTT